MGLADVRGVKVHFPIKRGVIFDKVIGHVYAVDGVDLQIRRFVEGSAKVADPLKLYEVCPMTDASSHRPWTRGTGKPVGPSALITRG